MRTSIEVNSTRCQHGVSPRSRLSQQKCFHPIGSVCSSSNNPLRKGQMSKGEVRGEVRHPESRGYWQAVGATVTKRWQEQVFSGNQCARCPSSGGTVGSGRPRARNRDCRVQSPASSPLTRIFCPSVTTLAAASISCPPGRTDIRHHILQKSRRRPARVS